MAKVVKFKFSLNDTVYFMYKNEVTMGTVIELEFIESEDGVSVGYAVDAGSPSRKSIDEKECFSSKAKLLKSL